MPAPHKRKIANNPWTTPRDPGLKLGLPSGMRGYGLDSVRTWAPNAGVAVSLEEIQQLRGS